MHKIARVGTARASEYRPLHARMATICAIGRLTTNIL
jgi:hypothetical protein